MNKTKQIELIRKHNSELIKQKDELFKQIEDMRLKSEMDFQLNAKEHQKARNLICELERIRQDWLLALDDLNEKREKYSSLIVELETIKKVMINMGFDIPWYKKIINKLKRF